MPYQGRVKWFNNEKGYGFVEREDGLEVFAHYSTIVSDEPFKTLHKGDQVRFDLADSEKGPKALNIRIVTTTEADRNSL